MARGAGRSWGRPVQRASLPLAAVLVAVTNCSALSGEPMPTPHDGPLRFGGDDGTLCIPAGSSPDYTYAFDAVAVAVKRGSAGASLATAAGRWDREALPVRAVDTVGAGDAFCAGLLSALLDGRTHGDALDRAVALGAWAVSTKGDWAGLPTRAELDGLTSLRPGETLR